MSTLRLIFFVYFITIGFNAKAQAIHLRNRYGSKIYFVDGNTLKANNRYGEAILYCEDSII
ncbi:MAG: hypothetical protein WCE57_09900, partial [Salegentibacter sp.]